MALLCLGRLPSNRDRASAGGERPADPNPKLLPRPRLRDDVARVRRRAGVSILGVGWVAVNSLALLSGGKEQPLSQSRPYPRGGSMTRRSLRSRSAIACSASPVAVLCKGSGSV